MSCHRILRDKFIHTQGCEAFHRQPPDHCSKEIPGRGLRLSQTDQGNIPFYKFVGWLFQLSLSQHLQISYSFWPRKDSIPRSCIGFRKGSLVCPSKISFRAWHGTRRICAYIDYDRAKLAVMKFGRSLHVVTIGWFSLLVKKKHMSRLCSQAADLNVPWSFFKKASWMLCASDQFARAPQLVSLCLYFDHS